LTVQFPPLAAVDAGLELAQILVGVDVDLDPPGVALGFGQLNGG
jgi:hypothetical protein